MVAVIAHRGASAVAPENSLEAFCEARRLGADGIELDVRRSADDALVVHHDATIGDRGPVVTLNVTHLPLDVPLLEPAIAAAGDLLVNIELKDLPGEPGYDPGQRLAALVAGFVVERGLATRVIVSSFDLAAIDLIRRVESAIPTAWLTTSGYDQQDALETVIRHGHAGLHPQFGGVTAALVDRAHKAGVIVNTWTVDEPALMRELADAGVDGVITNRPDVALAVLR